MSAGNKILSSHANESSAYISTSDLPFVITEGIVAVSTIAGNVILLLAYSRFHILHTPTNFLAASRAMADLFMGVVILPAALLPPLQMVRKFNACLLLNSLLVAAANVSVMSLAGVALDHFMAVRSPFLYFDTVTLEITYLVSTIVWVISLGFTVVLMILHKDPSQYVEGECQFEKVIDVQCMVFGIYIPVIFPTMAATMIAFAYVFYVVSQMKKRDRALFSSLEHKAHQGLRTDRWGARGMRGLFLLIVVYYVCQMPLVVHNFLSIYSATHKQQTNVKHFTQALIVLSHVSSAVDPLIYTAYNGKMKSAVKSVALCGARQDSEVPDDLATCKTIATLRARRKKAERSPDNDDNVLSSSSFSSIITSMETEFLSTDKVEVNVVTTKTTSSPRSLHEIHSSAALSLPDNAPVLATTALELGEKSPHPLEPGTPAVIMEDAMGAEEPRSDTITLQESFSSLTSLTFYHVPKELFSSLVSPFYQTTAMGLDSDSATDSPLLDAASLSAQIGLKKELR